MVSNHASNDWISFKFLGNLVVVFLGKVREAVKLQGSKGGPNLKRAHGNFILLPEIVLCVDCKSLGLTS